MRDTINQQINLARYFRLKNDYRSAQVVLQRVEKLIYNMTSYPYLATFHELQKEVEEHVTQPDSEYLALCLEGSPPQDTLTPEILKEEITPFIEALKNLQSVFNAMLKQTADTVIVSRLSQADTIQLEVQGARQATHAVQQEIGPWREQTTNDRDQWRKDPSAYALHIELARDRLALKLILDAAGNLSELERFYHAKRMADPLDVLMFGRVGVFV